MNEKAEGLGFNPESRGKIEYIKAQIEDSKVFELKDGPARDLAADQALRSVGISGVDNLVDLMNKREDRNINQEALADQIDYLGVAIGEVIMKSGNEEMKRAVMAGSFSTERFLPDGWRIDGDKYTGDQSLARVIVDGVKSSCIKDPQKRGLVVRAMEIVDFYKNNPQYKETGLLESQIDISIGVLNGLLNPLNRKEMDFISGELVYLQELKVKMGRGANSANRDSFSVAAEKMVEAAEVFSKNVERDGIDRKKMLDVILRGKRMAGHRASDGLVPPEDYIPGSPFEEGAEAKYYTRYEIAMAALAVSMKVMDPDGARFDAYRPTEWYKNLPKELRDVIDVMIEINGAAASTYYFGKDLEKLISSKRNFSFTSEKMRTLFNDDFKLGMSKMLNDLCEEYVDNNGYSCLRYKEKFYRLAEKGEMSDDRGFFIRQDGVDENGHIIYKRVEISQTEENKNRGALTLDEGVLGKLDFIEDYKEEIALFLAKQHGDDGFVRYDENIDGHKKGEFILNEKGERLPKPIYQMYAYTAWNLWYGMGDSSVADRLRMLPTWDKIVSDAIRTLNPEYKALGKWMVYKTGREKGPSGLVEAEYFSGEVGDYVISIMGIEDTLGEPLNGPETLRQKLNNGTVEIFPDKTLYGFFDFVNGGRDLVKPQTENGREVKFYEKNTSRNEEVSLAKLLMNYGYKTVSRPNGRVEGVFDTANKRDFNFRSNQTTFMNEFRDSYEAAVLVNQAITGKLDGKDPVKWARQLKSAFGMANQPEFNGSKIVGQYARSPWLWRAMIAGTYGVDSSRLSTRYIPIKVPENSKDKNYKAPYAFAVFDLLNQMNLPGVDMVTLMQLLGVNVAKGDHLRGENVRRKTEGWVKVDGLVLEEVTKRFRKLQRRDRVVNEDPIVKEIETRYSGNNQFDELRQAYRRYLRSGEKEAAERVLKQIKHLFPGF